MTSPNLVAAVITDATAIGFYLVYALIAVGLVAFLARSLSRNGEVFLDRVFEREAVAHAVNQLLVIGFYLLNLGYALLVYRLQPEPVTLVAAFNELVGKLGLLLLSLGVIHLANMAVFWRIGRPTAAATPEPLRPPTSFPPPPDPTQRVGGAV
jgi:amino acid transporter